MHCRISIFVCLHIAQLISWNSTQGCQKKEAKQYIENKPGCANIGNYHLFITLMKGMKRIKKMCWTKCMHNIEHILFVYFRFIGCIPKYMHAWPALVAPCQIINQAC